MSDSADALVARYAEALAAKRPDEALALADRLLATPERSAQAHHLRGLALEKLGRQTEAVTSYEKAVADDSRLRDAWLSLLEASAKTESLEVLEGRAGLYLSHFPGDPVVLHFMSSRYIMAGDWKKSIAALSHALRSEPDHRMSYSDLVTALAGDGRFDEAAQALDRGKSTRHGFDAEGCARLNAQGVSLYRDGRFEEAAQCFRKAMARHIEEETPHVNLGACLHKLGRLAHPPAIGIANNLSRLRDVFFSCAVVIDRSTPWKALESSWGGHLIQKFPGDLVVYQEIVHVTRPTVIVECGTYKGGSALFFASLCDQYNAGRVVTIDVTSRDGRPSHPRITYITGSSTDPSVVARVRSMLGPDERVMVILDSDHSTSHVRAELEAFHRLVTPGCYLVVEDTCIDLSPVANQFYQGGGPLPAVAEFIGEHSDFYIDRSRERFLLTVAPYGFLLRLP